MRPRLTGGGGLGTVLEPTDGAYEEVILHSARAARLSPRDPAKVWWTLPMVLAAFGAGRPEEQIEWARRITETTPDHPGGWRFLAEGYAELDRLDEARAALGQYLRLVPHDTIEMVRETVPSRSPCRSGTEKADAEYWIVFAAAA